MSTGETLAQAREKAGLTATQVSARTRIRAVIIGDIERDDFSSSPGGFYARGDIREIARVVGFDPAPLIEDYDTAHTPPAMPELLPAAPPEATATERGRTRDDRMTAPAYLAGQP
jgi:cytoskeletal protein RodZ